MNILGISAFYHDSAACLVQDGKIVAAAQEERFTRKKHDLSFPINAIKYCLQNSGLSGKDLDYVAFYDKPFLKFERILETYLSYAPIGIKSFIKAMPLWIKQKLWMKELIKKKLRYEGKIIFTEHHESHAASAFFSSPFQEAAFLTIDGVGEWATARQYLENNEDVYAIGCTHLLAFNHSENWMIYSSSYIGVYDFIAYKTGTNIFKPVKNDTWPSIILLSRRPPRGSKNWLGAFYTDIASPDFKRQHIQVFKLKEKIE